MSSKKIKTEYEAVETLETDIVEGLEAENKETVAEKATEITEKVIAEPVNNVNEGYASVMYVGPSIANVVQSSTVFKGGIFPREVDKYVESKPYIKKLFVPVSELSKAMKELNNDKSALSIIYNKVKNEI